GAIRVPPARRGRAAWRAARWIERCTRSVWWAYAAVVRSFSPERGILSGLMTARIRAEAPNYGGDPGPPSAARAGCVAGCTVDRTLRAQRLVGACRRSPEL